MTKDTEICLSPPPLGANFFLGWLCAEPCEFYEAEKMFDKRYSSTHLVQATNDENDYHLGQIGEHYVVMNCPISQASDESQAPKIAKDMKSTFPQIRFILLVGIGGAAPSKQNDIRLGDVVFGLKVHPYSHGAVNEDPSDDSTETKQPPEPLLAATTLLKTGDRSNIPLQAAKNFILPEDDSARRPTRDILYESEYSCEGPGCDCKDPQKENPSSHEQDRPLAKHRDHIMIHTGIVGSAGRFMRIGKKRASYSKTHNIICFETGTAQVMDTVPSLAIRGIFDYSDGHQNDDWQSYASLVAAICAKRLLGHLQLEKVERFPFEWDPDQLKRYVKGATVEVNRTIGQVNKSNADLKDAERTVNALLERHDVVYNLVNDKLPDMRKHAGMKKTKENIESTRKMYCLMRSIQELQSELRMSLEDLKRKIHQQGKEVQRCDPKNTHLDEWKRLENNLESGIAVDEKLSRQFHHALSSMGHCLPAEEGHGKSDSTHKMWRAITSRLHEFKSSVSNIPARMSAKFRSSRHPGRQGKSQTTTKEHQDSERPATTEVQSPPNFMPDDQTAGIARPGHSFVNQYSEQAASTPSFALSGYQYPQQTIGNQSETVLPMQWGAYQRGIRPDNQLANPFPRNMEYPSGPQGTDFIDPPNVPGRPLAKRSNPSLYPASSHDQRSDHGDVFSQSGNIASSNTSLQSPDDRKRSPAPVQDSAQPL
ncbi:hypothetical protein PENSTE_c006G09838 [Penicillium steckii]|uniref:Nucleoside phosphorylase domain-containing protein n=1 Tax=Penicillium steckii TaxID=303698 RepID=A0A1V6TFR8_9EURO|nr:hypothetical protein PENSTE_c006G09838 [Penicillium steckii]